MFMSMTSYQFRLLKLFALFLMSIYDLCSAQLILKDQALAKALFERATGVKINIQDPRIIQMSQLLSQGKPKAAIQIAINDPMFTNVRAKNFAIQLSNKSGVVNKPLDDMSALITGIIRDNIDFRKILTSDFRYDLAGGGSEGSYVDMLMNNGFIEYEGNYLFQESDKNNNSRRFFNLHEALVKKDGFYTSIYIDRVDSVTAGAITSLTDRMQKLNQTLHVEKLPESAGVLTTRAFGINNYNGGTNRRPIEYVVTQFLCSSMSEIANNQVSDFYIGKDVSRFPGGDHEAFVNNCKSCHTIMDSWRGAFGKIDYKEFRTSGGGFLTGIVHGDIFRQDRFSSYLKIRDFWKLNNSNKSIDLTKYVVTSKSDVNDKLPIDVYFRDSVAIYNPDSNVNITNGIIKKMTPDSTSQGYTMTDNRFVNLAANKYGWRGPYSQGGVGLNQFGQMISDSRAFSTCITQKLFKDLCYSDLTAKPDRLEYWSTRFENINYQLKSLTGEIVLHPDCGLTRGAK